jgi:hypothetical protein
MATMDLPLPGEGAGGTEHGQPAAARAGSPLPQRWQLVMVSFD